VTVECDGKSLMGSPFVAKAFNPSAIQLTGMPSVGVIRFPVEFTGTPNACTVVFPFFLSMVKL